MKRFAVSFAFLLALLGASSSAHAVYGWINGQIRFKSELGNACSTAAPLSMNCTASMFPIAQTGIIRPVIGARIFLVDQNGIDIGIGSSDANGNFTVLWNSSTLPTRISVQRFHGDVDLKWWTADTAGYSIYTPVAAVNNPPAYTNFSIGTWTAWSYNVYDNVYEAMRMAWHNAYKFSSDLVSKINLVRVVVFAPSTGEINGVISVNGADGRKNWSIAHEFGHAVDEIHSGTKLCLAYNRPTNCNGVDPTFGACLGDSHSQADTTPGEHFCGGFHEGWADFLATTTLYGHAALKPMGCNSDTPCGLNFDFEKSLRTACTVNQQRNEMQVARYLWDTYDSTGAGDTGWTDSVPGWPGGRFAAIVNNFDLFPVGTDNGQRNEAWNSTLTLIDQQDGRSALDWKVLNDPIENTSAQFTNNCSPGN